MSDYFSKFNELQPEEIKFTEKKKPKIKLKRSKAKEWNANYKKREQNDKTIKGLHHKLLKYPKSLDEKIKLFLNADYLDEINCENDLFIFAVEKLIKEYE